MPKSCMGRIVVGSAEKARKSFGSLFLRQICRNRGEFVPRQARPNRLIAEQRFLVDSHFSQMQRVRHGTCLTILKHPTGINTANGV